MKNSFILFISILIHLSCQQKSEPKLPNIEIGNLYKVDLIKVKAENKALDISMNDQSFIYFDDYVSLKSDMLLHLNYDEIKDYENIKVSFTQRERPEVFKRNYNKKQLDSIHKELSSNKYLERNYRSLVTDFDVSEIWNLRSEVLNVSKTLKDEVELDYLELIQRYSKHQKEKDNIKESALYERMILIKDMFSEIGIEDVWTKERKKAPEFISKLNNIIEK